MRGYPTRNSALSSTGMKIHGPRPPAVDPPWYVRALIVFSSLAGWRPQRDVFYEAAPPRATSTSRALGALGAQDWLVLLYLTVLFLEVVAGAGARRDAALRCVGADLVIYGGTLWIVRGELVRQPIVRGLLYRVAVFIAIFGSFLQLQYVLPTVSGPPVDARLYALDLRLFGVEPSVAWDHLVSPATTEWYAFFYYGYFVIIAAHALPLLFFGKDARTLNAFSFGFIAIYCVGQVLYTLVPAYGPYAYLAPQLHHPLEGSFWWPLVRGMVESVDHGARTDVFPSLHTAAPTFIAIFSFQHRRLSPFRFTWAPLALFATQIVIATMFLRWHYLIDVCAGLVLAVAAARAASLAVRWDARRVAEGGPEVFPRLARERRPT
jgi:hypothetical protein